MAGKCSLCGTEHGPKQAHRFALPREVNHQAVSVSTDEVVRLKREVESLRHDLERYVGIAAKECERAEAAEKELAELRAKPSRREYMREYMKKRRAKERKGAAQERP